MSTDFFASNGFDSPSVASSVGPPVPPAPRRGPAPCPWAGWWDLAPQRVLSLRPRVDRVLVVGQGRVWVTLHRSASPAAPHQQPDGEWIWPAPEGVGDDVVLQAGDRCVVPAGSHVVMEAWPVSAGEAPVRFDWIDLPRPASAPSRFQQEVAMPLRASIGALGEALAAGGRSLGLLIVALWGILRYGEFFIPRRGQVLSALESCRS